MSRLTDYFLIAAAAVCGAFLVLLGRKYVFRGANSRAGRTFLLMLSMATVFLGTSFSGRSLAKEPFSQEAREAIKRADILKGRNTKDYPFWRRGEWDALTDRFDEIARLEPGELTAEKQTQLREKFAGEMSAFRKNCKISDFLAGYLEKEYARLLNRRSLVGEKIEKEPGYGFVKAIGDIKATCITLNKSKENSFFVRNLLRARLREQLAEMKDLPLKSRLQNLRVSREKYVSLLGDALDALSGYALNVAAVRERYVSTPFIDRKYDMMPRALTPKELETGKMIKEGLIRAAQAQRVYRDFRGTACSETPEVWLKRAGGEYVRLKQAGVDLYLNDLFVNKGDSEVEIKLEDGRFFKLGPKEVRVFFEMNLITPPGMEKEILGLIKQLGSEKYSDREVAEAKLIAKGLPAMPHLEKAAKEGVDMEIRGRAAAALQKFKEKQRKKNSYEAKKNLLVPLK